MFANADRDDLFSRRFVGFVGGRMGVGRVGDTHHPPNTAVDYDSWNTAKMQSDILD